MGRKIEEGESEILECIRDMIDVSVIPPNQIAQEAGYTRAQLYNFVKYSKGTQLIMAEKILDVLGFELQLKNKSIKRKIPRWVSCNEELPKEGKYLVCNGRGRKTIHLAFMHNGRWEQAGTYKKLDGIVAWMELPDPY